MSESSPVTFVNVIEIAAEDVEEFLVGWRERLELLAAAPGFLDAQLLRATSRDTRFQLINVAHWESEQAWRDAAADPELRRTVVRPGGYPALSATPNIGHYLPEVTVTGPPPDLTAARGVSAGARSAGSNAANPTPPAPSGPAGRPLTSTEGSVTG